MSLYDPHKQMVIRSVCSVWPVGSWSWKFTEDCFFLITLSGVIPTGKETMSMMVGAGGRTLLEAVGGRWKCYLMLDLFSQRIYGDDNVFWLPKIMRVRQTAICGLKMPVVKTGAEE